MRQRLKCAQTHLVNKAKVWWCTHSTAGTRRHNKMKPVEKAACPGMQPIRFRSPHPQPLDNKAAPARIQVGATIQQKRVLSLLPPQELCFCSALCLEGLSLSAQGLFPQSLRQTHVHKQWPQPRSYSFAASFFPLELNSVFSSHDYVSVLLLFSCNVTSMRSDGQGQGFTSQSQGHLGQSSCEVLQNKRVHLSGVWWLLSCKGMLFWLNFGQNFPIYPC